MEIIAKVRRVEPTEHINDKFKKRKLIVNSEEKSPYPQVLSFEAIQKNTSLLDNLNPGDEIKIFFNLKGREFLTKDSRQAVFNTLEIWKIDTLKKDADFSEPISEDINLNNHEEDNETLPF